ncbi:CPBP family intramembrane glutamic endopeptidase [Lysinibacillus pakistanensis]|uniref:CPBP family intramembrane glutamic endopeptidase n=1 Tax=Lysinibacillus pakistanensis TaxID=759811 RepID=UPI003D29A5AE
MVFGLWLIIIFTLIYEPFIGYFGYQKFKFAVRENPNARLNYYIKLIIGLWIPTISIILLVFFTDLDFKDIGLAYPNIDTKTLGNVITYSIFVIAILYLLNILYYFIAYHLSDKFRTKFIQAKEEQLNTVSFSDIIPVTSKEKKLWNYVSLTAGVTEEIIYRGFLIFALSYIFPSFSIWLIIFFSSLLFGLAHTYQGLLGVLKTTMVGILFSGIYIGLGSILPLIVFHFLIDYVAKLGDSKSEDKHLIHNQT